MNPSRSFRSLAAPAAALALGLIIGVTAVTGGVFGRAADPAAPSPSSPPPTPTMAPSPIPSPADDLADGRIEVALDIATDHDVSVIVDDQSRTLGDARSGRAGDGMSVRWYDLKVENVDAETLRVTWVGFAADAEIGLRIERIDGGYDFTLVQPVPPPNSDALGFDRVLILSFDQPVSADGVGTSMQGGLDTDD
jgi:hypothetical protein